MAQWPASLPPPTLEGYELSPLDQTIRTDMEVGAPRVRRRTRARLDRLRVRWILDDAQMATFRSFVDDEAGAAGGAAWVVMSLATGSGLEQREVRIIAWQARLLSPAYRWEVTAELEVR
jgi:hypothetical protein